MANVNVLLISADQWRGDCLGRLGHPLARTPNLDRLAADGVLFARHFSQAAPCGPARASLLTGLYPMNHRSVQNGTPLDRRHTNLALEARRLGYEPMLFGYTDTTPDPRDRAPGDPDLRSYGGTLPGFREGMRYQRCRFTSWQEARIPPGDRASGEPLPGMIPDPPEGEAVPLADTPAPYAAEDSDTAFTADRVLDHLRAHASTEGSGWFVHVVFFRPHPPFFAPAPYHARHRLSEVALPLRRSRRADELAQHPFLELWDLRQKRVGYLTGHRRDITALSDDEIRQMRSQYFGLIEEVDQHIGRLLDFLRESGQYEHTIVAFTCDHGEQLGDHGFWGKGGYFDQSYHIPLIIKPVGTHASGRRVDALTESVDIMPTLLDSLGGEIPPQCDGASLRTWLKGRTPERWRSAVHWEFDFRDVLHQSAESFLGLASTVCSLNVLRSDRHKLVHFAGLPPLLFDLQADPGEFHNLARDPAQGPLLLHLTQQLLDLRMRHADQRLANSRVTSNGWVSRHPAQDGWFTGGGVRQEDRTQASDTSNPPVQVRNPDGG